MLSAIISYCIAAACVLFVVSLPIGKFAIGATLKRLAGALVLVALAPALFFGVLASARAPRAASTAHATDTLALIGGMVVLALVSYAILAIRKRLRSTAKDAWSEYVHLRSSGKRPVDADPRASAPPSLFDEEAP